MTTNAYTKKLNNPLNLSEFALSIGKDRTYFYILKIKYNLKYNIILGNHINYAASYEMFIKKYENYKNIIMDICFEYFDSEIIFIDWIISLKIYKSNHFYNCKKNIDKLILSDKSLIDYSQKQLIKMEKIVKAYEEIKHQ